MNVDSRFSRRALLAGACVSVAGSQAFGQPAGNTISIKVLDEFAAPLRGAIIDVFGRPRGHTVAKERDRDEQPGEYSCVPLAGRMMLCVRRSQGGTPELTYNELWGPDSHRLVVALPGAESAESQLLRLINVANAVENLAVTARIYPQIREAYEASRLENLEGYVKLALGDLSQLADRKLADNARASLPYLEQKLRLLEESGNL